MVLGEKIWGNALGSFIAYGKTAAAAALKPLLVTDNGDGTGTLQVSGTMALPTGAATSAKQDTGNASLASIKTAVEGATPAASYKGKDRTTTTGAAEELTIPANSKRVILSCAPSSQVYIELNGDASTSSPLYFEDPFGPITLDLGSVTKLSAWVVEGNLGAIFFG